MNILRRALFVVILGTGLEATHAISGLMLSEAYAMSISASSDQMEQAIQQAIDATQQWPKARPVDRGGWRYLHPFRGPESDLSLVGWQMQFLRSAKNTGFRVPQEPIDAAVEYYGPDSELAPGRSCRGEQAPRKLRSGRYRHNRVELVRLLRLNERPDIGVTGR